MSRDEMIREITRIIKDSLYRGGTNVVLPADSFLDGAAGRIIDLMFPPWKEPTVYDYGKYGCVCARDSMVHSHKPMANWRGACGLCGCLTDPED